MSEEQKTVWVVHQSYENCCWVFSTEERANEFMNESTDPFREDLFVTEEPLDPPPEH